MEDTTFATLPEAPMNDTAENVERTLGDGVDFGMSPDDVMVPEPIPAGYHPFRICDTPLVKANKKKTDGLAASEGAGENIVLPVSLMSENPDHHGRRFSVYIPVVNESDLVTRIAATGQLKAHWKVGHANLLWSAFHQGQKNTTSKINFEVGDMALLYVNVVLRDGEPTNDLDVFKNKPRPYLGDVLQPAAYGTESEIPFG